MSEIVLREADLSADGDLHYILSSWLRTYRDEGKFTRRIRPKVFFEEHEKRVHACLDRSRAVVAHLEGQPSVILGYSILEPSPLVIHWVYVRPEFQKLGIGRRLIGDLDMNDASFSHWTLCADPLIDRVLKENPALNFNPYAF